MNCFLRMSLMFLVLQNFFVPNLCADVFTEEEIAGTYLLSEVDVPPKALVQESPQLGADLRGETGNVRVAFLIALDGSVEKVRVVKSTNPKLDDAVLEAIANWKFEPAKRAGTVVVVRVALPVRVK